MRLHIFDNSPHGDHARAVVKAIAGMVTKNNVLQHRTIAGLISGLPWNEWDEPVIVFTESDDELDQILAKGAYLSNCRIVLVLHNDALTTLAKGHKLRPRILFSQPVTAETIATVLARMAVGTSRPRQVAAGLSGP